MEKNGFAGMRKDRFGMFVHYGIYSEIGGIFEGRKWSGIGEWIQRRLEIPIEKYEAFGRKHFRPRADFAENLVLAAKAAGMKYIVITSKHHDGFCLFKSKYTSYSTDGFFGRDLCKEVADACARHGMELGFYYSHTLDWYEKDAGGNWDTEHNLPTDNRNYWDYPDENIDFDKYLYEKCFPQVEELLTNYGDLKVLWFDYPHNISKAQSEQLRALVKRLQPNCLISSRIAHNCGDYESLPDNALPFSPVGVNLECLITLNDTWGYKTEDNNWKSPAEVLDIFARCLGSDTTLLLNVGPMGDGSLTPETQSILEKIGAWTKRNAEAIYGDVHGNPFPTLHPWGSVAHKSSALYCYITDKTIPEIKMHIGTENEVCKVCLLGDAAKVQYTVSDGVLTLVQKDNDFTMPVYKVEFTRTPAFAKEIVQCDADISLGVLWAGKYYKGKEDAPAAPLLYVKNAYVPEFGSQGLVMNQDCHTIFWNREDELLGWEVYFKQAGDYDAAMVHAVEYIESGERQINDCAFALTVNDTQHSINMQEEKQRYALSRTQHGNTRVLRDAGIFTIPAPGKYKVFLKRIGDGQSVMVESVVFRKVRK